MLKLTDIKMSVDKALSLAQTSVTIQIQLPQNKEAMSRTMFMTQEKASKNGAKLINENFGVTR